MNAWAITDPVALLVVALAAFRLTRFFVYDSLVGSNLESGSRWGETLDRWAYTRDGKDRGWLRGKVADLLTCPWCLGFWLSLGCVAVWAEFPGWRWVLVPWAVAGAQGILSTWERR